MLMEDLHKPFCFCSAWRTINEQEILWVIQSLPSQTG
jgi:hypothetical protein